MGKEDFTSNDQEQWPGTSMPDWDSSDEASWESFPASDPPAVGSTFRVRPSAGAASEQRPTDAPALDEPEQRAEEPEMRRRVRGGVAPWMLAGLTAAAVLVGIVILRRRGTKS